MTRPHRSLLTAALGLLLLAATAHADGLRFIQVERNLVNGVTGLDGARGIAMSPDGRHVYTVSKLDDGVDTFSRDAATGRVTFVESHVHATTTDGLNGASAVAVSPDGLHVYVASYIDDALVAFSRDAVTGALTFVEMKRDGVAKVNGLDGAESIALSPDGKFVYVAASNDDGVGVFARDTATGMVTFVEAQKEGVNGATGLLGARGVAVSPDGSSVYVAGANEDALAVFIRDATTGKLTFLEVQRNLVGGVDGLDKARAVAISPDGATVYVAGGLSDALACFSRDPATGALTFIEVMKDSTGGVNGLNGSSAVTVSPDGTHVYTTGDVDDSLGVFDRDPVTGRLTYVERKHDSTAGVDGLNNADGVVVSPDSLLVYTVGYIDDAVAVFHTRQCGDGVRDPGEQCDDGNTENGDCCSSTCQLDAPGTACTTDGNPCTDDTCNDHGSCQHVNNTAPCDDGLFCTVGDVCGGGACHGTARDCSGPADQCNDGVCDEDAATCVAEPKADGTACNDGDLCTRQDVCTGGTCTGTDPVTCNVADQCHDAGTCNPATGTCSNQKPDGTPCNDNSVCTRTDRCQAGSCTGFDPIVCTALDQCHDAGTCNPATGVCPNPAKANGAPCDDGNLCTRSDACTGGACGGTPVVCTASNQCHAAGTCNSATGACSNPIMADGSACNDGNACTQIDFCRAGACLGTDPMTCAPADQCRDAGVCSAITGQCSSAAKADGTPCDDGNPNTDGDVCTAGVCGGDPLADRDGDGIPDVRDLCPGVYDPSQTDANHDGIGDACECTAPAPGRCVVGGAGANTDCLAEFNPASPSALNKKRNGLTCRDGDPACDRDGKADGQCTFSVSVCLANDDPRLARCRAADVRNFEVMSPSPDKAKVAIDRANGLALERTLSTAGLEIRRGGRIVTAFSGAAGHNLCSQLVDLVVPAPKGGRPSRKTLKMRATAVDGRSDIDSLTLECRK